MTRGERLAKQRAEAHAKLEASRKRLDQIEAQQREDARKARAKRKCLVGMLADAAGLLVWDDTTLGAIFGLLTPLTTVPNPVAVLEACLGDSAGVAQVSGEDRLSVHDVSYICQPGVYEIGGRENPYPNLSSTTALPRNAREREK